MIVNISPHHQHNQQQHVRDHDRDHDRTGQPQVRSRELISSRKKCMICSFTQPYPAEQVPVYHRHFSSLRLREYTGIEGTNTAYLCPSCKSHHSPYPDARVKIVVSGSTLHQFFAPPEDTCHTATQYSGDIQHCDYITIPRACIEDLIHAFRLDYDQEWQTKPLDVVMVAGYNDLAKGYGREFINHGFKEFSNVVLQQGNRSHPLTPNTVAIASLMYPPQLAWYPDNGREPAGYVNQMEKIHWLNYKINQLNLANNVPHYPRFHTYGVRTATRRWIDVYGQEHHRNIKMHRWEHWREAEPTQMLHLNNERRFKMGAAVNSYFVIRT